MREKYFKDDIVEVLIDEKNRYYITDEIPEMFIKVKWFSIQEYVFIVDSQEIKPVLKKHIRLYKRPLKNWIKSLLK